MKYMLKTLKLTSECVTNKPNLLIFHQYKISQSDFQGLNPNQFITAEVKGTCMHRPLSYQPRQKMGKKRVNVNTLTGPHL